jgi:hypothetical protein
MPTAWEVYLIGAALFSLMLVSDPMFVRSYRETIARNRAGHLLPPNERLALACVAVAFMGALWVILIPAKLFVMMLRARE